MLANQPPYNALGSRQIRYMYGGRSTNGTADTYLDDIWVLSLPSFIWTKVYEGTSPRFGHTCHRVGTRTMITVGGARNEDYSKLPCDWEYKGVGVLDMSDVKWGSVYNAQAPDYAVTKLVSAKIGGGGSGGASLQQPDGGFDEEGLARVFNVPWIPKPSPGAPANNSSNSSSSHSMAMSRAAMGPIIGGIIGGVTSVGIVSFLTVFYRRRLKRLFIDGSWPFEELDGQAKVEAELAAKIPRCELPAYEPAELSASVRWTKEPSSSEIPPPAWVPPVTDEGIPF